MKFFGNKNFWLNIGIGFVILLSFLVAISRFHNLNLEKHFGYLDDQTYWQALSEFAQGGVNYRDFIYEYGVFYLLPSLPFFLFLGKTFAASAFLMYLGLPISTTILSFFIGKEILKKGPLILFLLFLLLYEVNNSYVSLRHIIPELGLIMLIIGLEKNNQLKAVLGSFLLAFSFMLTLEYALIANIAVTIYFLIDLLRKPSKLILRKICQHLLFVSLVLIGYLLFLWQTKTLKNLVYFTLSNIKLWYTSSPCRELFPRLNEISLGLTKFCQRLNLYLIPLVLIILLIWVVTKRKSSSFPVITPLLIYTLLIFNRTLNTPCLGYMNYGLTFFFLILVFIPTRLKTSSLLKFFLWFLIIWFLLTSSPINILQLFTLPKQLISQKTSETAFLLTAGIKLKKELTAEYQAITDFILKNTQKDDYLYVYPHGPYYQLTKRKSSTTIVSSWNYDVTPSWTGKTVEQLAQKIPKLVIINVHNAWSMRSSLNNVYYNIHSEGKDIIFEGLMTPVEDFIAQNYEIVKKFKIAWVLKKRNIPVPLKKIYLPITEKIDWQIATKGLRQQADLSLDKTVRFNLERKNPLIELNSAALNSADFAKLPIKIGLGLDKIFSKFIVNIQALTDNNQAYLLTRQLATGDWQDIWFYLPKNDQSVGIKSIIISLSDNQGFFWWGKPETIALKAPELFVRNQNLAIDESAF